MLVGLALNVFPALLTFAFDDAASLGKESEGLPHHHHATEREGREGREGFCGSAARKNDDRPHKRDTAPLKETRQTPRSGAHAAAAAAGGGGGRAGCSGACLGGSTEPRRLRLPLFHSWNHHRLQHHRKPRLWDDNQVLSGLLRPGFNFGP